MTIEAPPPEACPCCGHSTLTARGAFELCPVCFWEDDGQDNADADEDRGGPNPTSLSDARRHYLLHGASDAKCLDSVRPPRPDERKLRRFELRDGRVVELDSG